MPNLTRIREMHILDVSSFATIAMLWGLISTGCILASGWMKLGNTWLIMGLSVYSLATVLSIMAGRAIKKIDDPALMEHINKTIQRRSVILLNGSVGAAIVIVTLFTVVYPTVITNGRIGPGRWSDCVTIANAL